MHGPDDLCEQLVGVLSLLLQNELEQLRTQVARFSELLLGNERFKGNNVGLQLEERRPQDVLLELGRKEPDALQRVLVLRLEGLHRVSEQLLLLLLLLQEFIDVHLILHLMW